MDKSQKRRIDSIVRKAERVIGECQLPVDSVYLDILRGKLEMLRCNQNIDMFSIISYTHTWHV